MAKSAQPMIPLARFIKQGDLSLPAKNYLIETIPPPTKETPSLHQARSFFYPIQSRYPYRNTEIKPT